MRQYLIFIFFLITSISVQLNAQEDESYKGNVFHVALGYGYQFPLADMDYLYGNNWNVNLELEYQLPSNYFFGLDGQYLFGSTVKVDVLRNLRNASGDIYGNDQAIASIDLRERGLYLGAYIGKIIPFTNSRSGLKLKLGAGYFQHKIRLQDNNNSVNQVYGDYEKGYDRFTFGLGINPFIGYQYISNNKRINYYIGIDAMLGFTQGRRDYQFDTMLPYKDTRFDGVIGIRAGWILPFFTTVHADELYYK
ncbi:MAG TPA: hypothetical protein VK590_14675 [Saprospiraceae bacterium]|nr:hypothetical protein [Saprospiraceae bacterium]